MRYQDRDEAVGCIKWILIGVAVLFLVGGCMNILGLG